jgi:hypothetical protein
LFLFQAGTGLSAVMAWQPLVFLGTISFPFYILHGPLGQLFYKKVIAMKVFGKVSACVRRRLRCNRVHISICPHTELDSPLGLGASAWARATSLREALVRLPLYPKTSMRTSHTETRCFCCLGDKEDKQPHTCARE